MSSVSRHFFFCPDWKVEVGLLSCILKTTLVFILLYNWFIWKATVERQSSCPKLLVFPLSFVSRWVRINVLVQAKVPAQAIQIYLPKIHPSAPVGHSTESFQCAKGNPCPHMQLQLLSFMAALLYMEMIILSSLRYRTELCCLWEFRQNILPLGMWDLWGI